MLDPLPHRVIATVRRIGRLDRRSPRNFRRWIEQTSNLLHLSVLLFVPLQTVVVTTLVNTVESLSFRLFPPLAARTYTLCGWTAMEFGVLVGGRSVGGSISPTGSRGVDAVSTGL